MMPLTIFEASEDFCAFPQPEDVFAERVAEHAELLLPLATVDLALVDPELEGTVHFILPIEPDEGCVGEGGDAAFNSLCRENWLGYRYSGGRCVVATGFDFFLLPRLRGASTRLADLNAHYAETRAGFARQRAEFQERGALYHPGLEPSAENRVALAALGGHAPGGNWTVTDFPLVRTTGGAADRASPLPLTEDGRAFRYIGAVDAYRYALTHDCALLLFFDPETRTALTTFDWS